MKKIVLFAFIWTALQVNGQVSKNSVTDELILGNAASEQAHHFSGELSKEIKGGLGETARILLPRPEKGWQGGSMSFTIKVNPDMQNYITVRFWGSDVSHDRLYLVCGDKQIGSRHLGDIDMLDIGSDYPFYNERFYYTTTLLPLSLTKGKTELTFEIRSQGLIWGYGQTWDKYQKDMVEDTRGIYKVYTHTDGAFTPPADEKQGVPPAYAKRPFPGAEVLDAVKIRVNNEIDKLIKGAKPLNQPQMQLLAKAYRVKWSFGYNNKELADRVLYSIDDFYKVYKANPKLAFADPSTPNPEWFGVGMIGQAIHLLHEPFKKKLDESISDGAGNKITRRAAYNEMLLYARGLNQKSRRQYTNQTMIKDLYGIYYANKALEDISPSDAIPEKDVLHYLYEAVGLQPWTGSDGEDGKPNYSMGTDYWQLTAKGLTKELGFVGNYGEVIDWCAEIYEATRPQPELPGDEKIKAQVEKIALARSYFRYPMLDDDKYAAMRQETHVGWRDAHYPGDVTYAQRPSWDGGPLQMATATLNPKLIGFVQQMFDDNQYFATVKARMKENGLRVTIGLLQVPDQYEMAKAQKPTNYKLPMSWDQPDFVFADEQDGVVAIKNGKEILYASLYWRARHAINNLAKVHYLTPNYDRVATIAIEEKFDSSGLFFTVPDYTNMGFANGGLKYPDDLHLANAGQKLPIPKIPVDVPYKTGQEHPLAGRANFYKMQYGNYIVAMNAATDKEFEVVVPKAFANAINLVDGKKIGKLETIKVPAQTTVVLYKM
ncbi:hypothetical protein [Parasediminibacterium sp. JCM 36343]|uniref:hypothetical protein n=1 Tax=Parasediminibacterium sp. JCM 36343 TaxID=3374279 RepID=UPI003977ED38